MNRKDIRDYILKHKDNYAKDAIMDTLVKHGASRTMVEAVYYEFEDKKIDASKGAESSSGDGSLAGIFSLIFGIISFIFLPLGLVAIVLGHIARRGGRKNGVALAGLILGYITFVLFVVLIVVFIFSFMFFVDAGSLLPNKFDMNNNLRASAVDSIVYSDDSMNGDNANEVWIVFTYTGAQRIGIAANGGKIDTFLGDECYSYAVSNLDISQEAGCSSDNENCDSLNETVSFLNSQTGIMKFVCDNSDFGESTVEIVRGDILEGSVQIDMINPSDGSVYMSTGVFRLTVGQ